MYSRSVDNSDTKNHYKHTHMTIRSTCINALINYTQFYFLGIFERWGGILPCNKQL